MSCQFCGGEIVHFRYRCGDCKTSVYCSEACVADDWKTRHFAQCGAPPTIIKREENALNTILKTLVIPNNPYETFNALMELRASVEDKGAFNFYVNEGPVQGNASLIKDALRSMQGSDLATRFTEPPTEKDVKRLLKDFGYKPSPGWRLLYDVDLENIEFLLENAPFFLRSGFDALIEARYFYWAMKYWDRWITKPNEEKALAILLEYYTGARIPNKDDPTKSMTHPQVTALWAKALGTPNLLERAFRYPELVDRVDFWYFLKEPFKPFVSGDELANYFFKAYEKQDALDAKLMKHLPGRWLSEVIVVEALRLLQEEKVVSILNYGMTQVFSDYFLDAFLVAAVQFRFTEKRLKAMLKRAGIAFLKNVIDKVYDATAREVALYYINKRSDAFRKVREMDERTYNQVK